MVCVDSMKMALNCLDELLSHSPVCQDISPERFRDFPCFATGSREKRAAFKFAVQKWVSLVRLRIVRILSGCHLQHSTDPHSPHLDPSGVESLDRNNPTKRCGIQTFKNELIKISVETRTA